MNKGKAVSINIKDREEKQFTLCFGYGSNEDVKKEEKSYLKTQKKNWKLRNMDKDKEKIKNPAKKHGLHINI